MLSGFNGGGGKMMVGVSRIVTGRVGGSSGGWGVEERRN